MSMLRDVHAAVCLQADGERALAEFAPASTADGSPADAEMVSNHQSELDRGG